MNVRPATRADVERLTDFVLAEAVEAEQRTLDRGATRQAVTACFDRDGLARYWVAEDSGALHGAIAIVTEWSDWNNASYWWIQFVFIEPHARGTGLLGRMLETIKSAAKAAGAPELRLYVHPDNARAVAAYVKQGFAELPYRIMSVPLR